MPKILDMLSPLNSWQRAWVLISALCFLAVGAYAYAYFPTVSKQQAVTLNALLDLPEFDFEKTKVEQEKCLTFMSSKPEYFLPCFNDAIARKATQQHEFDVAQERAFSEIEKGYLLVQSVFIGKLFGLWVAAIAGLYALGMGVAWVRRGAKGTA